LAKFSPKKREIKIVKFNTRKKSKFSPKKISIFGSKENNDINNLLEEKTTEPKNTFFKEFLV
jgi:hypothetical protein